LGVTASNRKDRPYIPVVRNAALEDFRRRNTDLKLAPVVAIIAALNEEDAIAAVLDAIPDNACGLRVDTLVIDDGSTDRTADVVTSHPGVHLVQLEQNCGHGVALRLGYQIASEYGAQIVVTLDADMQWDPVEIPVVLAPLVADEADFVIGSRVLGVAETDDRFRHAGVTPGSVPDLGAAHRRDLPGLPDRGAADHHAQADRGREQEGPQRPVRTPVRKSDPRDLVARAAPGPAARSQGR
jgi:hypothetical protein